MKKAILFVLLISAILSMLLFKAATGVDTGNCIGEGGSMKSTKYGKRYCLIIKKNYAQF